MAKRRVLLHLGPVLPGLADPHESLLRDDVLAGAGIGVPDVTALRMHLADVEVRGAHRAEGLRRRQVEGSWSAVCRATHRSRGDVLLSQPRFADLDVEQAELAADHLVGLALHLVLTPPPGATADPDQLAPSWTRLVTRRHRVHVLALGPGAHPADLACGVVDLVAADDRRRREAGLLRRIAA